MEKQAIPDDTNVLRLLATASEMPRRAKNADEPSAYH